MDRCSIWFDGGLHTYLYYFLLSLHRTRTQRTRSTITLEGFRSKFALLSSLVWAWAGGGVSEAVAINSRSCTTNYSHSAGCTENQARPDGQNPIRTGQNLAWQWRKVYG